MSEVKARGSNGRATRTPKQRESDLKAAELRSKSWTYAMIAKELGLSTPTGAFHAVQRGMKEIPTEGAAEAKRLELEKLDTLERAAWTVLEAHHYVMIESGPKAGTIMYHPDRPEEPLTDDGPVLAAIDRVLKCQDRRAKLLGLDAPSKKQVEVLTHDAFTVAMEKLTAEVAALESVESGDPS